MCGARRRRAGALRAGASGSPRATSSCWRSPPSTGWSWPTTSEALLGMLAPTRRGPAAARCPRRLPRRAAAVRPPGPLLSDHAPGLDAIASDLRAPRRLDLRSYDHEVGAAWLWLAAARRTVRAAAGGARRAAAALAGRASRPREAARCGVRLGGVGPRGRPRAPALPRPAARHPARPPDRDRARAVLEGTRAPREDPRRLRRRRPHRRGPVPRRATAGSGARSRTRPGGWGSATLVHVQAREPPGAPRAPARRRAGSGRVRVPAASRPRGVAR